MKESLVKLEGITKSYDGQMILDDLNLDIYQNSFVTLLGPSGCGKTTTLRIIGGFETPDKGKVIFDGQDITSLPPHKRALNTVFQKYALFPNMTIEDNIAFGLKIKKKSKQYIKDKIAYALKLVNLKGYEKRMPDSLSGGQQQRIAIARAIVNEPKVLLLDEPLGALDLKLRQDMQYELIRMKKELGITFIYVTHDQEEALTMSDHIIVMNQGYIQQQGSPEKIYNEPENAFVADFIGDSNIIGATFIQDELVEILGSRFACVDKGFGRNKPVDVVIRPEDVDLLPEGQGSLEGVVTHMIFKGVHYEMEVMAGGFEWLVHSTDMFPIGTKVSIHVDPFDIQIMNKLLPFYDNVIETTVTYANQNDNSFEFELEGETVTVPDKYYEEGTKLKITLPPDALSLAGDGVGDLKDLYIESVVYKGEHNEIILESDERKWLMLSDTDEQVATYVPLSFNFSKARFEVISEFSEKEG